MLEYFVCLTLLYFEVLKFLFCEVKKESKFLLISVQSLEIYT